MLPGSIEDWQIVLVSLEGDGLEGWGFGEHWGLFAEHRLGVIWFVLNGFELVGLLLLDSPVGSAVDSGVSGELRDWDVAGSVGVGRQDRACSSNRWRCSGDGRL